MIRRIRNYTVCSGRKKIIESEGGRGLRLSKLRCCRVRTRSCRRATPASSPSTCPTIPPKPFTTKAFSLPSTYFFASGFGLLKPRNNEPGARTGTKVRVANDLRGRGLKRSEWRTRGGRVCHVACPISQTPMQTRAHVPRVPGGGFLSTEKEKGGGSPSKQKKYENPCLCHTTIRSAFMSRPNSKISMLDSI